MIALVIWIILILAGIVRRKSKLLAYIQLLFMCLMFWYSTSSNDLADRPNLLEYFNRVTADIGSVSGSNWLYKLIFYITGIWGSFNLTIVVIGVIGLFLTYKTVKGYTDALSYVFSLYLLAPFVINIVQLKNFFGSAILIYFFKYLFRKETDKYWWIKYLLGVFLAGSIHPSLFVMIIFVLVPIISVKTITLIVIAINAVSLIIGSFGLIRRLVNMLAGIHIPIVSDILAKYIAYSYLYYIGRVNNRILYMIIPFFLFLCIWGVINIAYPNKNLDIRRGFMSMVLKINILILILIPLLSFSVEFYRIQRNMLIFIYIITAEYSKKGLLEYRKLRIVEFSNILISVAIAFFYLYIDVILWNMDTVFCPLFHLR